MSETQAGPSDPLPRLRRARLAARLVMTAERVWPLLLPFLLAVSLGLGVTWLGLFRVLPGSWRIAALAAIGLALALSLTPLRFLRRPTAAEIDRRLEQVNALRHTPVLVQTDRPADAGGDPFAAALWREHQRRMAARLTALASGAPRTGVPEHDPFGLRAVVVLLLVAAFAFSFGPLGGRVSDAFRVPPQAPPLPPRIDAWVTPPAYTGKAPVFLADAKGPLTVPENSEVSLRVTGGSGAETLAFTDGAGTHAIAAQAAEEKPAKAPAQASDSSAPLQFAGKLTASGALVLADGASELRRWTFTVSPDAAPTVRFTAEPKRAANGALELAYEIKDDYGAASAKAGFALAEPQPSGARPLYRAPEMPLTLPRRGAKAPTAKASRDLTEHVWAGSTVSLVLHAADAAGQEGVSEAKAIVLPRHNFTNPLAKALIEQRKMLGMDANAKPRVLELMEAITLRPEDTIPNAAHYLGLESARTRLALAETDDQLRDVVDYLWQVAVGIEEGDLSDAQKRLARAQEALKQALENGASDEEIERLMKELRQAANEFLREFAENAQKNPDMSQMSPDAQEMRPQDLDRLMDQIENLAKSGSKEEAQELLSELQDLMNNLQTARPQQGEQGQQNSEMRNQLNKLGELMRRQQEMMNETFRLEQQQQGQNQRGEGQQSENGEQGQGEQGQGQQGQGQQPGGAQRPMTPEEFAQALKNLQEGQGKLQQDLQALQKGLEGMGMQPGEGFGDAGREMGKAEGSLGRGEGNRAVGEQGRALEALRRGAQDMMQQMQEAMQGDEGGSEEGGRQSSADRDPLGRPRATTGPDLGNSVKVPDEIDVQRARQILEAIRKRLGNAMSPQLEKDYLERLLELR